MMAQTGMSGGGTNATAMNNLMSNAQAETSTGDTTNTTTETSVSATGVSHTNTNEALSLLQAMELSATR